MIGIVFAIIIPGKADQSGHRTEIIEFVQINIMQLNMGVQTFEAFRIFQNGNIEWARWNSVGHLLGHGVLYDSNNHFFDKVVSSPSFIFPPKSLRDENILGRPIFRIDITTLSISGNRIVSMNNLPVDIAEITTQIKNNVKKSFLDSGWYIWTQPYPQIGNIDINLIEASNESGIGAFLLKAIKTGALVIKADEDYIQSFFSGERTNRIAFKARLAKGDLLFGILFVR